MGFVIDGDFGGKGSVFRHADEREGGKLGAPRRRGIGPHVLVQTNGGEHLTIRLSWMAHDHWAWITFQSIRFTKISNQVTGELLANRRLGSCFLILVRH